MIAISTNPPIHQSTKSWTRRPYEKAALAAVRSVRTLVLLWARQCRKSTTLGAIAFDEMSRAPGRRVIAASASLLLGSEFPPNPQGHLYRGQNAILIHRVALPDASAAGHVLYDPNTAAPLTLEQFYAQALNRGALRRNYLLIHEFGGAAAIDLLALDAAQHRGLGQSALFSADTDANFDLALAFLRQNLGDGPVGLGFDVATTTRAASNPSSLTVTEQLGADRVQRLVLLWKERQPQVARHRLRRVLETIAARPCGGRARRLCIDASSERYFAQETADLLRPLVPVELVIHGAALHPPGYSQPTNMKTYLGNLYSACFNDNHYTAPPGAYYKTDHRLVIKDRGAYLCDPSPDGLHGDTFDSGKLAHWALTPALGALLDPALIRTGPNYCPYHPPFIPARLR